MIKKLINFLTLVFLLVLCINGLFVYPSADDFSYFVRQNTHGFWAFQKWHYYNWGGRYLPNMILGSFGYEGWGLLVYRAVGLLMILGLYFSIVLFVKKLLARQAPFFLTNLLFLTYCFSLFSLSQAFYWLPGSITYTLSLILSLLSWSTLDQIRKLPYFFFNVVIVILLNGTNEISMLFYNISLFLFLLFSMIKNKKVNFPVSILFCLSVGCMLFSILAPGNTVRTLAENKPHNHDFIYSISRALYRMGTFTAEKLFIFLLLGPILLKELKLDLLKINIGSVPSWIPTVACIFFPFAILCIGIFPSYYATGRIPPERTVNTISFYSLIAVIFSVGFYKANVVIEQPKKSPLINLLSIAILLFIGLYPNDLRSNVFDLFSGRSNQFNKEMKQRIAYLENTPARDVAIKKISVLPNTLLFKDISSDPKSFFNIYYAKYFNKNTIYIEE